MKGVARRRLTLSLVGLVATPVWADDQPSADPAERAVAQRAAEAGTEQAGRVMSAGSPNSRATAGFSESKIGFSQESGETSVSIAFSFDLTSYRPPSKPDDYYRYNRTKLTVVASTPIEQGGTDSLLFKGDSLVSGSKLTLGVVGFSTRVGTGKGAGPEISTAIRRCVSTNAQKWVQAQSDREGAAGAAATFVAKLDRQLAWRAPRVNFDGVMVEAASSGELGAAVAKACYPGAEGSDLRDEYDLVSTYGDDPATFARRFLPQNARLTFWGVDASMGRDDHEYLDRSAFKLETRPQTSWEVGAYYGFVNSDLTFSLRARAVYGQSYSDQDEAEICRTVSIPAGTECIKGPDGTPLRERTGLFSIEARKRIPLANGTEIAIAPQVTYRIEGNNVGVEVPIYLAPDKEGKLSGGIKAVYNSKGDEFAVGLFVGVPFSIFYD